MIQRVIPNLITGFRILLAVPLVITLHTGHYTIALITLVVAGISDGLDGYLARRWNCISRLGAILDPISDKALLVSCYVTLGVMGQLPLWLVALVLLRDVIIISGATAYHYLIGRVEMEPTIISKVNTLFQIVLVVTVIMSCSIMAIPDTVITVLIYLVAFTTLSSGIGYVWKWSLRALQNRKKVS